MKSFIYRTSFAFFFILVLIVTLFTSACRPQGNQPPKITNVKADTTYVYPKGSAELECLALDPEGDSMTFTWSCADGSFVGSGPIVTWNAPNAYGDFHIMVIVEDSSGKSSQATITIHAIVNTNEQGCSTCPTRR